ncbi:hypothetical protein [Shimia thalassica]|uniref:hypothetical protein n=1 Tax=Shimia thalassica TaxID=1715693 RepID=UPI0026E39F35|nr:hypothetical protein [Shimia thalassica]MDO6480969.1 hypothetical protein [Shimia thalassica]
MRTITITTFALILFSAPSVAEATIADLSHSELVNGCHDALESQEDDRAIELAAELLERREFRHDGDTHKRGIKCLEIVYDDPFLFLGRGYSPIGTDQVFPTLKLRRMQERHEAFEQAVIEACILEYDVDKFRALTTPVCGVVFKAIGLPDGQ